MHLIVSFLDFQSLLTAFYFFFNYFSSFLFLSPIFLTLFKRPSFFVFFSVNPLLKTLPNGEWSNLACSITLGFYPKSSPVRYSFFLKLSEEYVDILAANLSKSYCARFALILLSITLSWSVTVNFIRMK